MGIEGQPGISRSSSNRTEPELVLDATIEGKDSTSHPFLHMNEKDVVWEMQVYGNWKNRGIKVTSVITALRGGDTEERIEREGEQSGEWIPTAGKKRVKRVC